MSSTKEIIYDWIGGNAALFRSINSFNGPVYDNAMGAIYRATDYHKFPYYFIALIVFATLMLLLRKLRNQAGVRVYLGVWIGVFCVMAASYGVNTLAVNFLKANTDCARPYAAKGFEPGQVRLLIPKNEDFNDDYRSFPSPHVAFITVIIVSLWPVIGELWWLGALTIPVVGWSVIAVGMNFPADVLGGFLLAFIIVLILRSIIYSLLYRLFALKC
jgi:membrane-associated phospholipid phosphatase